VWTALIGLLLTDEYGHWVQTVLSVLIALLAMLFVFEGFIANVGYLHAFASTRRSRSRPQRARSPSVRPPPG
jgi:hypothetical protein